MKINLSIIFLSFSFICSGSIPEPFAIMDTSPEKLGKRLTVIQEKDYFPNLPASYKQGKSFILGGFDYNTMKYSVEAQNQNPFPLNKISIILPKGEYGFTAFALRTYQSIENLQVCISDLKGKNGTIPVTNIRLLQVTRSQKYPACDFIVTPDLNLIPGNSLLVFAVLINVPDSIAAGNYQALIQFRNKQETAALPLSLGVTEKIPPLDIPVGNYMSFFACDQQGIGARWAHSGLPRKYYKHYFRFCATRDMNSPAFFHVIPEFINKRKLVMKFDTVDGLIKAIRDAGKCHGLVFDLRFFGTTAKKLAKEPEFRSQGLDDIAIYRNLVQQFFAHIRKNNYPKAYFCAEEEISGHREKLPIFNRFGKHLQEIVGMEHALCLDNPSIYPVCDYGHRDNYLYRQYNSWGETTLANAQLAGAEVWTYNYSYQRPSFGLLLAKLNSRGHHQWAEWKTRYITLPTECGVISSLQAEKLHEGITDYRYLMLLKQKSQPLFNDLLKDVPIDGRNAFYQFLTEYTCAANDLLRHRAYSSLQGEKINCPGTPFKSSSIKMTSMPDSRKLAVKCQIKALKVSSAYSIDGNWKPFMGKNMANSTGALHFMGSKLQMLKANASNPEEFERTSKKHNYSTARVAYNEKGMIFTLSQYTIKHGTGKKTDNDREMWQDNCMEIMCLLPDNNKYQLIINASDAKTLIINEKVTDASKIQIASKSYPKDGFFQEVFVPWSVFGLKKMPVEGTVWRFNVGRELHTIKEYTSWAPVENSFQETERWGILEFPKRHKMIYLKNFDNRILYPGRNRISGKITVQEPLQIVLSDQNGKILKQKVLNDKDHSFEFSFLKSFTKKTIFHKLSIIRNGKTMESALLLSSATDRLMTAPEKGIEAVAGDIIPIPVFFNLSDEELKYGKINFHLKDLKGKTVHSFQCTPSSKRRQLLWLNTTDFIPGKYTIIPQIRNSPLENQIPEGDQIQLTVYPSGP